MEFGLGMLQTWNDAFTELPPLPPPILTQISPAGIPHHALKGRKKVLLHLQVGAQLLSWKTTSLLLTGHVDSPCRQPPTFKHVHTGSYTSVPSLQMFYHLMTLIFFQGIMRSAFIARESSAEISVLKSILARSCCHSSRDRAATSCCTPNDSHRPRLSLYSDDG